MPDPRSRFIHKIRTLNKNEPFTDKENSKYSYQQKNFIRGIQVVRKIRKKDALKIFRKTQKDIEFSKNLSNDITQESEKGVSFGEIPPVRGRYTELKEKPYRYKGKTKEATKAQKARFQSLGGKSRRYIDTRTEEEISRRERDKRISEVV